MTSRVALERAAFVAAADQEAYLRDHSNLPGPRGNLELIEAASASASPADLRRWAALEPSVAPTNTPGEFVVAVGVVGLGRLVAAGERALLPELRTASRDPRWRVREAVAIGLQHWGDLDRAALLEAMQGWAGGLPLEGRAAMAALCEPRLLQDRATVAGTLAILDQLTAQVRDASDHRAVDVRVLRQALGYGWSVAVAADPGLGVPVFERWLVEPDPDVRWIMRENLAKARLAKAAPAWLAAARVRLAAG
ncbi:MAG: hypothetical protein ACHQZR_08525 [Candidatus Limnocylindrales bacterium]